jgi:bifunctional enzyme CysN/CysC
MGTPTPGRPRRVQLLRLATAGSVDDGKSTLIGRLLYDTKAIFTDQLAAVEAVCAARGDEYTNLALLTDGLRAEREQGITIDVAYRYFATPRRSFIIADTPGHVQYTRNMVTGASTADLALILLDARKGLLEQSRRHAFLCSLLRVGHLVVCVNKMDLIGYDRDVFEAIAEQFAAFAARLDCPDVTIIPVCALHGDNVVTRSPAMPWYQGPSLLHHLEHVHIGSDRNLVDTRFPVQYVIRPQSATHPDYRGYAGQVASGVLRPRDQVVVLPAGLTTTITGIDSADGPLDQAHPPLSVTLRLADDLDLSRGDMIARPHNAPAVSQNIEAMLCWMDQTRTTRALIRDLRYRLDVNTLHRDCDTDTLRLNDIGRVQIRTTTPLLADEYRRNRATGGFILIDETTNATVAAGMILQAQ